ncbi:MAG TPA: TrmH family RNA methyltransferase [Candidatus Saccharimonadales bacterium]
MQPEDTSNIGVGPHAKPWPTDKKYDPVLLEYGDTRNVLDKYRYWKNEAIVVDLDKHRSPLHIAIENWQHDFNIGTIVRNANAFNVAAVHIIGKRQWNKRGAMVTNRYLHVLHHPTVADFVAAMNKEDREIIAVDNLTGARQLSKTALPRHCVLVFGGEGPGMSQELARAASRMVAIEQFGSTRSVNVGVASGIVMYTWMQQHILGK